MESDYDLGNPWLYIPMIVVEHVPRIMKRHVSPANRYQSTTTCIIPYPSHSDYARRQLLFMGYYIYQP